MAKKASTLLRALPILHRYEWDSEKKDLVKVRTTPQEYAFIREGENVVRVSGENGYGFIDYYGEFRGGYPWIHPKLEAWAEKRGYFWEWENASNIALYE